MVTLTQLNELDLKIKKKNDMSSPLLKEFSDELIGDS